MLDLLKKVLPDPNTRKIRAMMPTVDHIKDLEPEMAKLSDDELRAKTDYFREMLKNREHDEDPKRDYQLEQEMLGLLLPEAFAVVREVSKRRLGMRHFDVQMVGGMVLHNNGIAEMRTGEGKTLVATLPAYLNALTGKGVHIVTVNDYLARRDSEWMGEIYKALGLTVGLVLSEQRGMNAFAEKKAAYAADITYGTNNEFGFDYLRDNMATAKNQLCQRPYNYAIIDEVDSILIDEARTPLIISGRLEQSAELYRTLARVAPQLTIDEDYTVDEKARNVVLTEEGIDRAQEILNVEDLFEIEHNLAHYLLCALKAKELFKRDFDYVVKDGQAVIVDEFTGRMMEGRRWSDGLHQSIEAKEGLNIQDETQTLASITFQNLFRLYPKLSGMTGTAMTEEAEFGKIYNLPVTSTPTNRADVRKDIPDTIYKNEKVKLYKAIEEIVEYHEKGRPILVGTVSIERSEEISRVLSKPVEMTKHLRENAHRLLQHLENGNDKDKAVASQHARLLKSPEAATPKDFEDRAEEYADRPELADFFRSLGKTAKTIQAIQKGIPHNVLNAKHHESEAMIVAQAGRYAAVTIATNMAGRGTDILLGGNPELLAKAELLEKNRDWREVPAEQLDAIIEEKRKVTDEEKKKVIALGGLHIIGTERHESRRIDNQLRGRAARQGDPGSTHFFLSLEDGLMRKFGGDKISGLMDMLGVDESMPISAAMVSGAIENAQKKVEAYYFDIRKSILQYDDVLTEQRSMVYTQRRKVVDGQNIRNDVIHMIERVMARVVSMHLVIGQRWDDWEEETINGLLAAVHGVSPQLKHINKQALEGKTLQQVTEYVQQEGLKLYEKIEGELTTTAEQLEREHGVILTSVTDAEGEQEIKDLSVEKQKELRHPLRRVERDILLSIIDNLWIDHLHQLDHLRDGIGLRAYGQKDPLIEYKSEAYQLFQNMTYQIQQHFVMMLFNTKVEVQLQRQAAPAETEEQSIS